MMLRLFNQQLFSKTGKVIPYGRKLHCGKCKVCLTFSGHEI